MKSRLLTVAIVTVLGFGGVFTAVPAALAQTAPPAESHMPGEVLVRLRTEADLPTVLARHSLVNVGQFGSRPIFRLRLVGSTDVDAKVAALSADPLVLMAEPNVVHTTPESRKNVVWAIGGSAQGRSTQWATVAIDLYDAHAVSKGQGVRVAVLDTGVDRTHSALRTRLLPGYDFVDGDTDPSERGNAANAGWGHGTHVAGIVALVAPQARIMPLRVLEPSGRGNLWVLGEALLHAVDPDGNPYTDDGAQVINLSLGTTRETRLMDKLLELVTCGDDDDDDDDDDSSNGYEDDGTRCNLRGGAVVVAAAGNGASSTERQYPAAEGVDGLIAIAATTPSNRLASFSNRGTWIELAAPGERIISSVPGGGWGIWSGTSMAAPMAAGVAALLRAANPSWKAVDVTKRIADRSASLCGTVLRQVDASGSLRDYVPPDVPCS